MTAVRDPAFWKRFSVAVHQDEQEKEERQQRPELKHSYVTLPSNPTTTEPLLKATTRISRPPPIIIGEKHTSIRVSTHTFSPTSPSSTVYSPMKTPALQPWPSITSPTLLRQPSKLRKAPPKSPHPYTPALPTRNSVQPAFPLRHGNGSQLTLGLSGRPPSRFKFWTHISAGANNNRDSWLEGQLKKKKQRTWMCWLFWLIFLALVAGVVVVVLLLKARHIIK